MKLSLAINESKKNAVEIAARFASLSLKSGAESVKVATQFKNDFNVDGVIFDDSIYKDADVLVTFGGDGTLLRHASSAAPLGLPILGINVGTVGFLTGAETDDLRGVVSSLFSKEYLIEERAMLDVKVGPRHYLALNEAVLSRGVSNKLAEFKVYVDDQFVDIYRADGFIVSTATGSTAYALSAGGPVLSPSVKGLVLTPICSHCLHSRPIVVSSEETVVLEVLSGGSDMEIDGYGYRLNVSKIFVSTARERLQLIRLSRDTFYEKLLCKLNQWSKS